MRDKWRGGDATVAIKSTTQKKPSSPCNEIDQSVQCSERCHDDTPPLFRLAPCEFVPVHSPKKAPALDTIPAAFPTMVGVRSVAAESLGEDKGRGFPEPLPIAEPGEERLAEVGEMGEAGGGVMTGGGVSLSRGGDMWYEVLG